VLCATHSRLYNAKRGCLSEDGCAVSLCTNTSKGCSRTVPTRWCRMGYFQRQPLGHSVLCLTTTVQRYDNPAGVGADSNRVLARYAVVNQRRANGQLDVSLR